MYAKNHDYDEAWRMRISSYTDLIFDEDLSTTNREESWRQDVVSRGRDANHMDMINYALFGLIKAGVFGEE